MPIKLRCHLAPARSKRGKPVTLLAAINLISRPARSEYSESPQRELGDPSSPAYRAALRRTTRNPPNGSWGTLQVPPTGLRCAVQPGIPPTGVGGNFKSRLQGWDRSHNPQSPQRKL